MTFSGYLSDQEIRELRKAALNGGLLEVSRPLLLQGLPSAFVAGLPQTSNQLDQFALDLVHVNGVERMANGQIPVLIMLQNAADRLRLAERQEAEIFERLIDSIGSATGGERTGAGSPPGTPPQSRPTPASKAGSDRTQGSTSRGRASHGQSAWKRITSWDVSIRAALISGVFVLLAALVPVILSAAHSANSGKANSSNRVRPSGSILTPADGAVKQSPVVVTGTAENVRRGYQLDLFSKINDDPRYYAAGDPESTVYFSNGRWSATINFGKATGAIAIWLVELSPQNVRKMNSESHDQAIGFPGLLGTVLAFERFTVK